MSPITTQAYALGFRDIVYDLSDKPVQGVVYLHRMHCAPEHGASSNPADYQHQYLSLCHAHWDHSLFLEAVIEVFHRPRDPKAKRAGKLRDQQLKGAVALYTNLARDWETIQTMVTKVYPLHVEPK